MKYYTLNNGKKMPSFGLGTYKLEAGESAYNIVLEALKMGYRHIDTAVMYNNEKEVGKAIRDSKIPRNEIFVTTKVFKQHDGNKELIIKDIEDSLKRLDIEYIDLLLIHWPNNDYEINDIVWNIFEDYYEKGIVKSIGVSNFKIHHLEYLMKNAKIKPQVNQVETHPLLNQIPLQKYLQNLDIQMVSYGPFAKGKVLEEPFKTELELIGKSYNASLNQVIIAWGLKRNIVMIPKTSRIERLKENLDSINIDLTQNDINTINSLNRAIRVYSDPDNAQFYK